MAVALIISLQPATAHATTTEIGQISPIVSRNDISSIISRKAFVYDVDEHLISEIVQCESSFNLDATNITKKEKSYGLVQINTLVHDVTIEQAKDPEFAIDFLAKNIKKGKADDMWVTCYRKAIKGV